MAKYHINPKTGNPGICRAKSFGACPYGDEDRHYETKEDARKGYELEREKYFAPKLDTYYGDIRFNKTIDDADLEATEKQLKNIWLYKPTKKISVKDRHASAFGAYKLEYEPATQQYSYVKYVRYQRLPLASSGDLKVVLKKAAEGSGYWDEEYDPVDWDED